MADTTRWDEGLDDFEKQLAAEKAERERAAEKEERRKHRHGRDDRDKDSRRRHRDRDDDGHRSHRSHRHRDDDKDDEGHRSKRSRHSRDGEGSSSRRHRSEERERESGQTVHDRGEDVPSYMKRPDPKDRTLPLPDEEKTPVMERDSWMTAPSAVDVDYIHRPVKEVKPKKEEPKRVMHYRELNRSLNTDLEDMPGVGSLGDSEAPTQRDISYKIGDEGSQWRMTKLKAVYTTADQTGRPVEEVAVERFGSLEEFDDAREEKLELDRRKVYGEGYSGKEQPSGELFRERRLQDRSPTPQDPVQGVVIEDQIQPAARLDQTSLNRLRAQMMKAKLRNAPDAAKLEAEYNAAASSFAANLNNGNNPIVLDATHNRMLAGTRGEVKTVGNKRGRERGTVVENDDMSLDDMLREEKRTRGVPGGEGRRLAERIAKDGKFDDDLEYLDENAEKLAKRVHKSEASLKNMAVSEFQKLNRILDTCPLCHHDDRAPPQDLPIAPIVSLATRVYLTLAPEPELNGAEGGAVIVPTAHHTNLLECDDDEWEEIRNFMKSLTRLYHDQGREVLFYENAANPGRRRHATLVAVPIPYDLGDTAPAFFKEAMLSSDEEWTQHKKIIDTGKAARNGLGKLAFRRSIAKEMPYFHVWFDLDGGLGHIVEDAARWPKGDGFARGIVGGMLDAEPDVIKKEGKWTRSDPRMEDFRKRWRKFDWTRILVESQ
ncbi:hypothetical protein DL546_005737 [Coniochaeta pulveracea]|uniref:Cell cycle control protein n=1 Tax=Coniochaeta pulveracea TaxID=177199 RepID=A0A420YLQ9_9PEZI|nr:hypothetical protein DL546_005737 [Coniochaeta pulveracea]